MHIKMDKQTVDFIMFLIGISMKYGVPAVQRMIDDIRDEELTKSDLLDLLIKKDPESFFK